MARIVPTPAQLVAASKDLLYEIEMRGLSPAQRRRASHTDTTPVKRLGSQTA